MNWLVQINSLYVESVLGCYGQGIQSAYAYNMRQIKLQLRSTNERLLLACKWVKTACAPHKFWLGVDHCDESADALVRSKRWTVLYTHCSICRINRQKHWFGQYAEQSCTHTARFVESIVRGTGSVNTLTSHTNRTTSVLVFMEVGMGEVCVQPVLIWRALFWVISRFRMSMYCAVSGCHAGWAYVSMQLMYCLYARVLFKKI